MNTYLPIHEWLKIIIERKVNITLCLALSEQLSAKVVGKNLLDNGGRIEGFKAGQLKGLNFLWVRRIDFVMIFKTD